ncbi:hypothetical protein SAMN05216286_1346 [Kosakonia oryzae]|uniref:Uncharacterized protein n=1 Tax=Kosakonia oryzae TaxID=497725 RepID=A0AA94KP59_9ENTR|nr:hypothetical protein SAMN05216286_1346 [Kosakonia oryzae]
MAKWRVSFKASKGNIYSTPYTEIVASCEEDAVILAERKLKQKMPLSRDYDWQVTSVKLIE